MRSIYTLTLSSTILGNKSRGSSLNLLKWLDATRTDDFSFIRWISSSFIYNLPLLERESWLCIFLQDDFFLVDLIKKMGYDGEITVYDLATIFHEKKNKKKIQWLININSTQSQQKMSTHSIHVRVVCQSAAIEHMDFVRDSYDFLKSIPAVAWKAWRFCVQENTIRSNSRHGLYNLFSSKFIW